MADKAYIVANEEQEREVLERLEKEGRKWRTGESAIETIPSRVSLKRVVFPMAIIDMSDTFLAHIIPLDENYLCDVEIVYDGRKESKMKIDEKTYKALTNWKDAYDFPEHRLTGHEINDLPVLVDAWWKTNDKLNVKEKNERLLAIVQFAMGEQPFEVEKPKKWVVRSKFKDNDGDYWYVRLQDEITELSTVGYDVDVATKFDTKEEAESWANAHQEVVEVEG